SPLAAKHSAETQVEAVELGGGEAGVGRVCGRLCGWRLAVDRVVVGSELMIKILRRVVDSDEKALHNLVSLLQTTQRRGEQS
ncbi:hypothetical protein, partial [Ralstonia holmesii]|uniref:hypothetical protein n=1 Tax=Ralstonia holmesii TaxID=3058602 RepID=UPI002931CCA1